MLHHQKRHRLVQSALHHLAFAGRLPITECTKDTDHAVGPAHNINDRRSCAQRLPSWARHIGEATHKLNDLIECQAVLIRPGQEALEGTKDQARIAFRHLFITNSETLHRSRRVVLDDDICAFDQFLRDFEALFPFHVDGDAALVSIESSVEARAEPGQFPRFVAAWRRFDLD